MRNWRQAVAVMMAVGLSAAACGDKTTVEQSTTVATETVVEQAALDGVARQVVERFELPGTAIQIRVDDHEPTTAVAGLANLETQQPLTDPDQLRIYSVTKAVTALVVLQLADDGVLSLDDLITDWLPPSVIGEVPNSGQMTVRQLLNHSSGTADYFDTVQPGEQTPAFVGELFAQAQTGEFHWYSPQELIDFSTQFEPPFTPGAGVAYSNTGYVILGLVVESATGNHLEDEMTSRVFEPLGLTSTYLETPTTANDYVPGYQPVGDGQLVSVAGSNSSFAWAAGGLISNIHDFGRLADALFKGELLTAASYEAMFTFTPDANNDVVEWGMGVYRLDTQWGPVEVVEGGAPGYAAIAFRFRDQNATILGMFNRNDTAQAFEFVVERSLELTTR